MDLGEHGSRDEDREARQVDVDLLIVKKLLDFSKSCSLGGVGECSPGRGLGIWDRLEDTEESLVGSRTEERLDSGDCLGGTTGGCFGVRDSLVFDQFAKLSRNLVLVGG